MMGHWQSRRVLVTGAYGFLASHLIEELLSRGALVTGIVRDRPSESYLQLAGLDTKTSLALGDIADLDFCRRIINEQQIQTVFHLAAQAIVGLSNRSPLSTLESNIRGTYVLLEACRELRADKCPIEAIVVASSDKAYGDQDVLPYVETMPLLGIHPYDASKVCTDIITRMFASTFGLPTAVTRFANLYGPGDLNFSRIVPDTFRALILGQRPVIRSDGTPLRDYLFVKNAVTGYLVLAETLSLGQCHGQAFNFGTGMPVTVIDLVKQIIKSTHSKVTPKILGEAQGEIKHQYLDSTLAKKTLGWSASTPLNKGLSHTYSWYKKYLS
jgi:CDP-glucose 4,6-dehydratase